MLQVQRDAPLKDTLNYLAKFPRFSLFEKIEPRFFPTSVEASRRVAEQIRDAIWAKNQRTADPFVLGLATGSTPLKVYKELIGMVKRGELSFKNVVTFNLDEYYPIANDNRQSYNYYMRENLFNHIDCPPGNINIPNGEIPREEVSHFCEQYEKKIRDYGGIDLQILGIGRTGHIGFNEPPSPAKSSTRLVYLHRLTRKDAANSFNGIENVPKCAITMGIDTISKAKRIIIMAWGQSKAYIVKKSIEGEQTIEIPSTFLHTHPDAVFYLDKGAGQELSRFKIPWTIKGDKEDPIIPYTKYWICKRVFWLCKQTNKPILRLTFDDYEDHGLSPLVMDVSMGNVEDLNLFVYKHLHQRITGWPLGDRPPQRKESNLTLLHKTSLRKERVLIFSPHPDDDVISMGATLGKLKDQGHDVMIAYMTSGSNAVHDYQTMKYLYFMNDLLKFNKKIWSSATQQPSEKQSLESMLEIINQAKRNIAEKKENETASLDNDIVRSIKSLIRSSEAKIAVSCYGIPAEDVYCMNLPFYTHQSKRRDISEEDRVILVDLLKLTEPTVIYAAGDMTDPHGTHRKCLELIIQVLEQEKQKTKEDPTHINLLPPPEKIFFYRGAWQEWDLAMCRVIVPMSPSDVEHKMSSILKHQSQKDHPMFPGDDKREFWMRSKDRNRNTAVLLKDLGLSDYEAVECFVNYEDFTNFVEF